MNTAATSPLKFSLPQLLPPSLHRNSKRFYHLLKCDSHQGLQEHHYEHSSHIPLEIQSSFPTVLVFRKRKFLMSRSQVPESWYQLVTTPRRLCNSCLRYTRPQWFQQESQD